jgi:flagellar basal-body rod protein FlgF
MENALLVGLSRQMALSHQLDIIANNVANIDTTAYKADNESFGQYLMPGASDGQFSGNDKRLSFVQDRGSWIDFSPGAIERTGDPLNVAIDGDGFLTVQTARGQRYTRNGALQINGSGQLVTSEGDPVLGGSGPITFQQGDHNVNISPSGIITVRRRQHGGFAARPIAACRVRPAAAFAKRRRLDVHGAERHHARSSAGHHPPHARRGRKIQRQCRR